MSFPTITIPDPAAVGKWLDEQVPQHERDSPHNPSYEAGQWICLHWYNRKNYVVGRGDSPDSLLEGIRRQLAENDPLAKLRKEAEAQGYCLFKLPED